MEDVHLLDEANSIRELLKEVVIDVLKDATKDADPGCNVEEIGQGWTERRWWAWLKWLVKMSTGAEDKYLLEEVSGAWNMLEEDMYAVFEDVRNRRAHWEIGRAR
jgi:hypothetical protein